jgi:hypothetical protein
MPTAANLYDGIYYDGGYYDHEYQPGELNWGLEIDWDNDGLFNGDNEAGYMRALSLKRGREYQMCRDGSGFEPMMVGEVSITLKNVDRRFDPFNTTSELYPNVAPGKRFRLRVRYGDTVWDVMAGRIADIRSSSENGVNSVVIVGYDGIDALGKIIGNYPLAADTFVSETIENILDAAGFDNYVIDHIHDPLPFYWYDNQSAQQPSSLLQRMAQPKHTHGILYGLQQPIFWEPIF